MSIRLKLFIIISMMFLFACNKNNKDSDLLEKPTANIKNQTLKDVSISTGVLEPKNKVIIKSEVSGIIKKILVKEGDVLKKGDIILIIDPRILKNQREKLLLKIRRAKIEFGIQKREVENNLLLKDKGAVSISSYLDLKDRLDLKEIQLKELSIDLKDLDAELDKTVLKAPMSGTLISLDVEQGEIIVSATRGYSGGTIVGTVANLSVMQVVCNVSEVDYHGLSINKKAKIYLESDPNTITNGIISFIAASAKKETNRSVRSFEIKIDIEKPDKKMVSGINVSVELIMLERVNVPCLPYSFVSREKNKFGKKSYFVYIKQEKSKPKRTNVIIGETDYRNIEIISGISDLDIIVEKETKKKNKKK